MARTAIATLQVVWDCRWSQPGHRLTNVPDHAQPESRWVCTREGHRRNVDEHECETCAYWEHGDAAVLNAPLTAVAGAIPTPADPARLALALDLSVRFVTLLTAILLLVSGFTILTGPLMIPAVVVLWLGAAAFGAFTFFGRLPAGSASEAHPPAD